MPSAAFHKGNHIFPPAIFEHFLEVIQVAVRYHHSPECVPEIGLLIAVPAVIGREVLVGNGVAAVHPHNLQGDILGGYTLDEAVVLLKFLLLVEKLFILVHFRKFFPGKSTEYDCNRRLFAQFGVQGIDGSPQPDVFSAIDSLEGEVCPPLPQIYRHKILHTGKLHPALTEFFVNVRAEQFDTL